jgi:ATP-dependent exoDNAse (exonuclease V) alpha subunit
MIGSTKKSLTTITTKKQLHDILFKLLQPTKQASRHPVAQLPPYLPIGPGTKVMLLTNHKPEVGLHNGTRGVVRYIIKDPQDDITSPHAVVCDFSQHARPQDKDLLKEVPILRQEQEFQTTGKGFTVVRENFPLVVNYATTIHKVRN